MFLEDDLDFNRSLRFNLEHWPPLMERPEQAAALTRAAFATVTANYTADVVAPLVRVMVGVGEEQKRES